MAHGNKKEKNGEHPMGDTGQLILLAIFLLVWISDSFFIRQSTFLSNYVPLYARLFLSGLALITAVFLFRSAHDKVIHGQQPEHVITTGAFRHVRHPLYLAGILIYLALAVSTLSLYSFVLLIVIFIFYNYIASYEERLLEAKFGEEYRTYKKKTGKWIPEIGTKFQFRQT